MLPSSHNPSIIRHRPELFSSDQELAVVSSQQESGLSRPVALTVGSATQTAASAQALAEAFASFVSTSTRLESAYRELQGEVCGLRVELAQRNSALKESLAENQRVRRALQQIVDSMPCGVLVVTHDGQLSTVNPEASRLLELLALSPSPASLAEIESRLGFGHQLTQLANRGADAEQEFCWHSAAGERWLHVLFRQIAGSTPHTTPPLAIFIIRDVTAQKREENNREAARNATILAEITTMLAHEIRNPLASLELFANLIEQDAVRRKEWIANLRAGIRTLSGTVNNVLSLHDAGRLALRPLQLAEIIRSAVQFARPLADQACTSLRWSGDMAKVRVLGSHSALQQVLLNLIRNAIRHTDAGGAITLMLEQRDADQVLLHCTDTGCGIAADLVADIFEPGFSGSGDSPGLGLAVCRRIMKQHNGSISVANVPDAGTRFTLTFPNFKEEFAAG